MQVQGGGPGERLRNPNPSGSSVTEWFPAPKLGRVTTALSKLPASLENLIVYVAAGIPPTIAALLVREPVAQALAVLVVTAVTVAALPRIHRTRAERDADAREREIKGQLKFVEYEQYLARKRIGHKGPFG